MLDYNPYTHPIRNSSHGPVYDAVLSYKFFEEDETEPVTLTEAKDWCAVDGTDLDTRLLMLIKAARKKVEKAKQMSLINRVVVAKIKPGTNLPFGPVREIAGIEDGSGATYSALIDARCDVTVTYAAGPGEDPLSEDLKVEILQQVAYMLENRGDDKTTSGSISPMIKGHRNDFRIQK